MTALSEQEFRVKSVEALEDARRALSAFADEVSDALRLSNSKWADALPLALGEAPVQQSRGLIPVRRAALLDQPVHHRDHQSASAAVFPKA